MDHKTIDCGTGMTEKDFREIFAENLRTLRKARNLTQSELGKLCGLNEKSSERMIQKWEYKESMPNAYNLKLLADALKVSADELLSK